MGKTKKLEKLNPRCCLCRLKAIELIHDIAIHLGKHAGTQSNYSRVSSEWRDWFDKKPPKDCRCD